ncbi:unnamed protein product [Ixodes hexagonus]
MWHVEGHDSIFFLETSGTGRLTARMSCAVESAAVHHPNRAVRLMYDGGWSLLPSSPYMDILRILPNVHVQRLDNNVFYQHPTLGLWLQEAAYEQSRFKMIHLSDALRLGILWLYGGIYLDLDVVVLKKIDPFVNSLVQSMNDMVANGILIFSRHHPFLDECLRALVSNYNPNVWGQNGPVLMRSVFLRWCEAAKVEDVVGKTCKSVTLLPRRYFLPLNYSQSHKFFRNRDAEEVWEASKDSYVMHVYGSGRVGAIAEPGSAYAMAARSNCPKSFALSLKLDGHF